MSAPTATARLCSFCKERAVRDTEPGPSGAYAIACTFCVADVAAAAEETRRTLERRQRVRDDESTPAAEVHPERVDWLWTGRVPLGMVTVIGGFPGVGKSTVDYDLAARASREGRTVLIVTAEDHLAAVARPRLEAAGADLELVRFVIVPVTLPEDVEVLARLVRLHEASMLVLDPLVAFIGDGINTHRDHHVRRVLAPLAALAEDTGAAIMVVIHTNKGTDSEPLMRISGSVGFTGAARSVLLCAEDPQDETRRILAVVKSNLAEIPPPLAYRLVGATVGDGISTSRVEWLGEAPEVDVHQLLAPRNLEERSSLAEAIEYLEEAGIRETARPAKALERDAEDGLGINRRTLRRAREALGVPAWREGFGRAGVWYWGPRPNEAPIGDTHRGHRTPVPLSPLDLPAETHPQAPIGDKGNGFGEDVADIPVRDQWRAEWRGVVRTAISANDNNLFMAARQLNEGGILDGNGGPWTAVKLEAYCTTYSEPDNLVGEPKEVSK